MRLLPLFVLLIATGCHDEPFTRPSGKTKQQPATTTIRTLCDSYVGTPFVVTGDIVVRGRVTADDRSGNFYRTLTIEQDGAGMEIRAAVEHLHNDFPTGCEVTLRLKGLALGSSYGVLQAGSQPLQGSGSVDYIPSKPALDAALGRNGERIEPATATVRRLAELTPASCGTLVRIEGLRYSPEELSAGTWAGYSRFTDDDGAEIHTYVSTYADFSDREIPTGRRTLQGILQYDAAGEGRYLIKPRDANDL